ncbi:hypothetical protein [Ruminococcus sp. HUN007]|uniref:hypothetical protein n=1 Tax=Ruminococcus sp. HUN007 TaxID=1514668 RepID=UPI0005D140F3|nr:hypothetical protein [Ruminococcus sp. HUN007]
MKNLFKIKKHKCPWCGNDVFMLSTYSSTKKKCDCCGHNYTYCDDSKACKAQKLSVGLMILCMFVVPFNFLPFIVVFFLSFYVSCYLFIPYERMDDTDKFMIKKYVSIITMYDIIKINPRKILSYYNIVPICFIKDNDIPISNDICILIESSKKIGPNEYECIFSFLPLSSVKFDIKEPNTKFIVFDNHEKVGEGIVKGEKEGF